MNKFLIFPIICLLSCFVLANVTDLQTQFYELAEKCKSISGATKEDIDQVILHATAKTKSAKCLRICLLQNLDTLKRTDEIADALVVYEACSKTLTHPFDICADIEEFEKCASAVTGDCDH